MKQCPIKRALSQYSAVVQWLCSAPVSPLLGSTGCTAPVPRLTSSNLPGADPSYPLNETGDNRCLRSCEDVWTVMASCNRANRNFATTLFSRALSTQLKCEFSSKFLQKQTEKEGDSLSAWGITTHTHRPSHLQPRAPCSALLLHEEAQLVVHLWLVELLPPPHPLSLREASQKYRRSLLLSAPKLTCEWGGNFSQLKSNLIPSEFKSQWQATTIAAASKEKVGRL